MNRKPIIRRRIDHRPVTDLERRIRDYIAGEIDRNGFPPTAQQLYHGVGSGRGAVWRAIRALVDKGQLAEIMPVGTLNLGLPRHQKKIQNTR